MAITKDELLTQTRKTLRGDIDETIRDVEEITEDIIEPVACIANRGLGKCYCSQCISARFSRATTPSALW